MSSPSCVRCGNIYPDRLTSGAPRDLDLDGVCYPCRTGTRDPLAPDWQEEFPRLSAAAQEVLASGGLIRPLPVRLREAADTLEEVSALYGYSHPEHAVWSAKELRLEAEVMERDTPEGSA